MAREVKLQNGQVAIVDDEDYERVNERKWSVKETHSKNAIRVYDSSSEDTLYIGSFILNTNKEEKIFHKDRNYLNFCKDNLIVINQRSLARRRRGNRNSSSIYKGVSWNKRNNCWTAQINANKNNIRLGHFKNEQEAAMCYNEAAREIYGEDAYINIIGEDNSARSYEVEKAVQKRVKNKTGYKGVTDRKGTYEVKVWDGNKFIYCGVFKDVIEAAKSYDLKAKEIFGNKAVLNFN